MSLKRSLTGLAQSNERALENLGACLLTGLLVLAALLLTSCQTINETPAPTGAEVLPLTFELFVGDPETAAIKRGQTRTMIACTDPSFSEFICLSAANFENILTEIEHLRKNQIIEAQ